MPFSTPSRCRTDFMLFSDAILKPSFAVAYLLFLRGFWPFRLYIPSSIFASSFPFLTIFPSNTLLALLFPRLFWWILSSHLNIGRSSGFPCEAFYGTVFGNDPSLRQACPAQTSRLLVMYSTILGVWYNNSFSSLFFRILHTPIFTSLHGPYIFLIIFLLKITSEFSSVFRNVSVSDP